MPRPTNTSRVVINGTLPGGEAFAWGFWMDGVVTSTPEANVAASSIASEFQTHALAQLKFLIAADSAYTTVTYYGYPDAIGPAAFVGEIPITGGTGNGTEASMPLQLAWVVTTRTALAGRRHRGRMYIPINALNLTSHQLTSSDNASQLGSVQDFLAAVNGSGNVPGSVAIVSQVVGEKVPVTTLSADSRLDVQRRRAASEAALFEATETL